MICICRNLKINSKQVFLIFFLGAACFFTGIKKVKSQCSTVTIDNTCATYYSVCASTDFVNNCGGTTGWFASHGTPQLIYVPSQQNGGKATPAYWYLQVVADNSGSEGVYTSFPFVPNQTYNVYVTMSTSGNGLLNCYAAKNLYQHQNPRSTGTNFYGCQAAIQTNGTNQFIGQAANTTSANFSFTANSNYNQLWFFSTFSGGTTFTGDITQIQVCPVCNIGTPNGLTTSNGQQTLNWSPVSGAYSYLITVSDTHFGTTTTRTYTSTTNSLNYCALGSGDLVSYSVQAVCANGSSTGPASSTYSFTTAYPTLPPPTGLMYSPPSTLSWSPVAGTNSYLVLVKSLPGGGIAPIPVNGTSVSGSSAELSTGASYQVTVSSSSGCIYGNPSAPISFIVPSCTPPTISNVEGGTYINIYNDPGASSYNIGWRNSSGVIVYQINNIGPVITTSGYQATGVPHGSFYIVAQANCSNGGTTAWGNPYFGGIQTTSIKSPAEMNSTLEPGDSAGAGVPRVFLSPNPSNGQLNVHYNADQSGSVYVTIIDELGREYIRKPVLAQKGGNNFTLNIQELKNGIYFIKLTSGRTILVKRLAVQK